MLKLVFLGRLQDSAAAPHREVPFAASLADVLAGLEPHLAAALQDERIRIAHNGELVANAGSLDLADGDEIAFLPPVSGG